jgi:hypothetical protein
MSTLDLVGTGLTLLTGPQGDRWLEAIEACTTESPIPLAGYVVGGELDSPDGSFCTRFGLGADGAVLVRPDGHIAWRREAGTVADHRTELATAIALCAGWPVAAPATPEELAAAA